MILSYRGTIVVWALSVLSKNLHSISELLDVFMAKYSVLAAFF
jgi:hypothetical protein